MLDYNEFNHVASLEGKLKPACCKSCREDGMTYGTCEKCLKNRAYNREYLQTHLFIYDSSFGSYHSANHTYWKQLPVRLPDEHPYLFYGIEVEVAFDENVIDADGDYMREVLRKFSETTDGMFVYEYDSSTYNTVEMISRPSSYAFWTNPETVEKLKQGFEYLRNEGALIDQPSANGLHIHLSRKFFQTEGKATQGSVAFLRFDWLFQKFQTEIEQLGDRKYTQYCASKRKKTEDNIKSSLYGRNAKMKVECELSPDDPNDIPYNDHSACVDLRDYTIETRVFKSTTDYREILSYIEMLRNFAHAVREDDINKSLDELLHTKDNLFLDEHIQRVKMKLGKKNKKLHLDKVNDNKIKFSFSV